MQSKFPAAENLLGTQLIQTEFPAVEYVPGMQSVQVVDEKAAATTKNLPVYAVCAL
jgi:hypothetical protein